MFRLLKSLAVILLLAFCVVAINGSTETEPSLYSPADNVNTLNNSTFEVELFSSPKCKLVQFINYFCGDCRRFAPTFKTVSTKLYDWERILSVIAVDCAQERNVQICREYNIRSTPTLRLFPPHFQRSEKQIGLDVDTLVPVEIIDKVSVFISNINYTKPQLPYFEPVTTEDTLFTLLAKVNYCDRNSLNYIVLVYQPINSTIGRDTILGLLKWPSVAVRIVSDAKIFTNFAYIGQAADKLAIMDCAGNILALKPKSDSSLNYIASVAEYLKTAGYAPLAELATTPTPRITNDLIDEEQAIILSTVLKGHGQVYRADLEQAIDKLLHIELPKVRVFEGDSLVALKLILNGLRLFNPLNASGKLLLERLYQFVAAIDSDKQLAGSIFQSQLQKLEKMLPKVFKAKRYVGCIASRPFLRGFTCSMWTLFHYLSVQAAKSTELPAGAALGIIHGFAKHFFGCADCVKHFLGMAERRKINSVTSRDEEILWLWEAHNEVNQRLAGDSTEDPKFPKIQFPSRSACGKCHNEKDDKMNRSEVLLYLKNIYDKKNLSNYGLPTATGYD